MFLVNTPFWMHIHGGYIWANTHARTPSPLIFWSRELEVLLVHTWMAEAQRAPEGLLVDV